MGEDYFLEEYIVSDLKYLRIELNRCSKSFRLRPSLSSASPKKVRLKLLLLSLPQHRLAGSAHQKCIHCKKALEYILHVLRNHRIFGADKVFWLVKPKHHDVYHVPVRRIRRPEPRSVY